MTYLFDDLYRHSNFRRDDLARDILVKEEKKRKEKKKRGDPEKEADLLISSEILILEETISKETISYYKFYTPHIRMHSCCMLTYYQI